MCTMIVETAPISGCGKGTQGWIKVDQVNVSFDHPFHAPFDHALNIDFVDSSKGAWSASGGGIGRRICQAAGAVHRGGVGAGQGVPLGWRTSGRDVPSIE